MTREVILITGDVVPLMVDEAVIAAAKEYWIQEYAVRRAYASEAHKLDAIEEVAAGTGGNLLVVGYSDDVKPFIPHATQLFMAFQPDIRNRRMRGSLLANPIVAQCAELREISVNYQVPYDTHVLNPGDKRLHGFPRAI